MEVTAERAIQTIPRAKPSGPVQESLIGFSRIEIQRGYCCNNKDPPKTVRIGMHAANIPTLRKSKLNSKGSCTPVTKHMKAKVRPISEAMAGLSKYGYRVAYGSIRTDTANPARVITIAAPRSSR